MIVTNYRDRAAFLPNRFSPVILGQSDRTKVVLACFEPGQFIPVHTPGADVTLIVLEGEGVIVAGDEEQAVGPGAIAVVPAGSARGIKATTQLIAAHVVTPPPTEEDHVEVHAKLKARTFR
ncbi:MAG: cupin domain-containing protein [Chloroflexi bacterium]|nr:cupin domain-containing protein [Chloroflexota bacterium]